MLAQGWNINDAAGTGGTGTPGTGSGNSTVKPGGSLNVEAGDNIEITVGNGDADGDADLNISVSDNPVFDSVTADTITANESVTVGTGANQTKIDGGTVTVDNQITVGGTNGTVINNESVSINNNSAYFRENAMKVGSMTYDGVSNTLDMGGAGRLTGLADGGVYMGSSDAVTGNQLWDAYQRMDDLQEGINIVGAHAAALSGLHPIDYNPYEPTTLSAAIGTYRDEYAVAVGVFHYVRENVLFNLGASICSDGDVMGRAGISFTVGRGGDKKKALAPKDMNEVQAQLAEVRQALHELKAENAALKVRLDAKSK